jgi:uncharacterized protein involved in exopolysaccharide biosynthesis
MQAGNDFWIYLNIIFKRLWLIALLFLVTEGVIASLSVTAKPIYRATVRLQVLATDSAEVSLFATTRSTTFVSEIQQAQNDFIRALKRGSVAWKTIADLNLEIGATDLLDGLSMALEGDFIVVTVESDDPGRAEAIATAQVNNALAEYREVRATPSRVLRQFVAEQLDAEKERLAEAEQGLLRFRQAHNLGSIEQETRSLQDLIRTLKLERDRNQIEQERVAIFADLYREQQAKALRTAEEIGAQTRDGEEAAPNTKKFYSDLALQHEATALNYEAQRDGYAASLVLYDGMIAERTAELQKLLGLNDEYTALSLALTRSQQNYGFLWEKENEARLKQLQAEKLGYIQITEAARKPDQPVKSRLYQLLLVGGVVSILTGFVLSFLIEFIASVSQAARRRAVH